MARLANLPGVLLVAAQAGFQVVQRLHAVAAAVEVVGPARLVVVGQHLPGGMAIVAELALGMANRALFFPALRFQGVGKLVIQRVGQAV